MKNFLKILIAVLFFCQTAQAQVYPSRDWVTLNLTFANATAKIIPGATSLTFRNAANTLDNFVLADAGPFTIPRGIATPLLSGLTAYSADMTANFAGSNFAGFTSGSNDVNQVLIKGVDATTGALFVLAKSRATNGSADTVVQNGDVLATIEARGSDGVNFRRAAQIVFTSNGAPGASDMPGAIDFLTTPDADVNPASVLKLSQDKSALFTGTVRSSGNDAGWAIVDQTDNQACTTGCTSACMFGIENATGSAITGIVSCAATTSDLCACMGAS